MPEILFGTARFEFEKFFGAQLRTVILHRDFLRSEFVCFDRRRIQQFDLVITNYETVTNKMAQTEAKKKVTDPSAFAFARFSWHRIILDESDHIRERNTKRFKAINKLVSERRWAMTGTPIHNRLADMYHQLMFCGLTLEKGDKMDKKTFKDLNLTSRTRFVDYCDVKSVNLPPKTVHKLYFDLTAEEKQLHQHFCKNSKLILVRANEARGRQKSSRALEARRSAVRLMQTCTAPYLLTPLSKDPNTGYIEGVVPDARVNRWLHEQDGPAGTGSSKMRTFVELVQRLRAQEPLKAVVFANWTSSLELAIRSLKQAIPDFKGFVYVNGKMNQVARDEGYTRFRTEDGVELLFMTLKLGNMGLNLSEANKVIFLEQWFSYSAMYQGEGRVHRIGQGRPVDVFRFMARSSIEEKIYQISERKKALAEEMSGGPRAQLSLVDIEEMLES